ncbi:4-hydroxy-tetrahydrodipicolinate reductase [Hyphobacterium sp.]|uniref:4-hydroxy-tetrahydrodipicolinate reductase n=1 Tax=Hyphobacterium sp. TaxID=2004662 RepID=UPI003B52A8AA
MPLGVTIIGIGGRLGSTIAREVIQDDRFKLVGGIVRSDSDHVDKDLGELAGTPWINRMSVVRLEDGLQGADIVIDASTPQSTVAVVRRLTENGGPALISGVTGFSDEQFDALRQAAETIPVLTARNFSIGISLVEMLVSTAAAALPAELWDAEISETHHRYKADAPSGTALVLGEAVANARHQMLDLVAEKSRSSADARRLPGAIGFSSRRGGAIVGDHEVGFLSNNEEITISHRALDRRVFAVGALTAANWLHGRSPGLYGMRDVINGN